MTGRFKRRQYTEEEREQLVVSTATKIRQLAGTHQQLIQMIEVAVKRFNAQQPKALGRLVVKRAQDGASDYVFMRKGKRADDFIPREKAIRFLKKTPPFDMTYQASRVAIDQLRTAIDWHEGLQKFEAKFLMAAGSALNATQETLRKSNEWHDMSIASIYTRHRMQLAENAKRKESLYGKKKHNYSKPEGVEMVSLPDLPVELKTVAKSQPEIHSEITMVPLPPLDD
jgi:hypothetical protein